MGTIQFSWAQIVIEVPCGLILSAKFMFYINLTRLRAQEVTSPCNKIKALHIF